MARPRKIGLDYFPHDVDASEDEKIEALRALYGNDGYAFYFILLERIYRSDNAELDISKKAILAALIKKIGISEEKFFEILETCFEVGLFDKERYERDCVLTSNGIKKRYNEVQIMRERWRKKKEASPVFPGENSEENTGENSEETGESKEKKSKEKQRKEKKSTPPPPISSPSSIDVNVDINVDENTEEEEAAAGAAAANCNPFRFYEENFGTLSPHIAERIEKLIGDIGPEMVVEAMKEAVANRARGIKYVEAIVNRWLANNIRSPAALEAERKNKAASNDEGLRAVPLIMQEAYKPIKQYNVDPDKLDKILAGGG